MNQSSHDPVQVPFLLPPQVTNEGQFAFTVDSISMPTRMKGTLTYMVKVRNLLFRFTGNLSLYAEQTGKNFVFFFFGVLHSLQQHWICVIADALFVPRDHYTPTKQMF